MYGLAKSFYFFNMKIIIGYLLLCTLVSCDRQSNDTKNMLARMDSLQRELDSSYRPGLGEFMLGIQVHHAKLWFAGQAGNWPLADFETKEIRESVGDIQAYCKDRPEVASIPVIGPPLDSIDAAVRNKNLARFKAGFIALTTSCNSCHQATKHGFNVIQVPSTPPFTNQSFQNSA